MIPKVEIRYSV